MLQLGEDILKGFRWFSIPLLRGEQSRLAHLLDGVPEAELSLDCLEVKLNKALLILIFRSQVSSEFALKVPENIGPQLFSLRFGVSGIKT